MINILKDNFIPSELLEGNYGIEREGLRCTAEGVLVDTPHPAAFGSKLHNKYITADFSESQLEFITPILKNVDEVYDFLENLYNIVSLEIGEEYIWPQSMPCALPEDGNIPVATFCKTPQGEKAYCYRLHLLQKYGGKKQVVSGIHYNFSFSEKIIECLYKNSNTEHCYKTFRDNLYLKVARNYLRYRWLIIYLLGGSSVVHNTYEQGCIDNLENVYNDTHSNKGALSYRNGECGYTNKYELYADYTNIDTYIKSIQTFVDNKKIDSPKELYTQIRIKAYDNDDLLNSLKEKGINYLELRSIDINPFDKTGIKKVDLDFLSVFNLFLLLKEETEYKNYLVEASENQYQIAKYGFYDMDLIKDGEGIKKSAWAEEILSEVQKINSFLNLNQGVALLHQMEKITNHKKTYAHMIFSQVKQHGYIKAHMNLAKSYKKDAYNNRYLFKGYTDLELSTQQILKESVKRGINVQVIDKEDNFIRLKDENHVEYIKQATKTSQDTYISMLIMENKIVTKKVLDENNICTPSGDNITRTDNLQHILDKYKNTAVVIKPKSTNFGTGISIFKEPTTKEDILNAINIAFKYDSSVLIEEFISGKEYRLLVIGQEVAAIVHRVPANVIGDGKRSIAELVEIKNTDPLRGVGYKTPLEKIKLDANSALFLKQQQMTFESIPTDGQTVYLRENSNVSTGGDSIDYTEQIANYFKEIAVKAAQSVGANICGVDMMIEDVTAKNKSYSIIELNFNPAIHMHHYPYKGREINVAAKVLDLLGYECKNC
ncbi:MAG: bifunctional glutamate--cysteine ligase/glutathione synthetase [Epulopiscium sp. Nuni2H_MBin003]|nr:MAG: bifunctional glutamate--cysteine ligase/glutathione synthetase [Epulopiscium sp. Nuni2H_MBin003]